MSHSLHPSLGELADAGRLKGRSTLTKYLLGAGQGAGVGVGGCGPPRLSDAPSSLHLEGLTSHFGVRGPQSLGAPDSQVTQEIP